jgi:hypothetical protein
LATHRNRRRYFGLHIDLHATVKDTELGARITPEDVRRLLDATRPDFVQYDCKGHPGVLGYPNSAISQSAPGIVQDALAIYRQATADRDIALLVHYSGVADVLAVADYPEWAAIDQNDAVIPGVTSVFGDYLNQRLLPHFREIIDRYDIDGFWVDGDCWSVKIDHHPVAKLRFEQRFPGASIPQKPGDPHWLAWGDIHREQFFDYVRRYVAAVREIKSGVIVTSNYLFTPHAPVSESSADIDFCSGDLAPNASIDAARLNARYLSGVPRRWDLMSWCFTRAKRTHAPWQPQLKPVAQLCQEAASVLAQGGGFQLFISPDRHGGFETWQIELLRQVADFVHERAPICDSTSTTVDQVAIWLDTADYFSRSHRLMAPWSGELAAVEGTLHALLDGGHDVCVRATHHFDDLRRWSLIVVPECGSPDAAMVERLKDFVREGGRLLIIGDATCRAFADVLDIDPVGESVTGDFYVHHVADPRRQVGRVFGPWLGSTSLPADVTTLAHRTRTAMRDDESAPAIVSRVVGAGQIIGLLGPFGTTAYRTHSPWVLRLISDAGTTLYKPLVTIHASPHAKIDLSIRRGERRLLIHLVNITGHATGTSAETERYHFVDAVPPSGPVQVNLRSDARPGTSRLMPQAHPVEWKQNSPGIWETVVAEVGIFSTVIVDS